MGSPKEAARTGLVITMLADDAATEAVLPEILEGLPQGGLHIAMSTLGVPYSRALWERHRRAGRRYLAAPVFGRPEAAARGELRIVVAGAPEDVEEARPLLKALGVEVYEVGDTPHLAHAVKLGGNFLIASMLEALSEAYVLVERNGVRREAFYEVVRGFFRSPVYEPTGGSFWKALQPPGSSSGWGSRTCASSTRRRTPPTRPCPSGTSSWTGSWRGWRGGWGRRTGPRSFGSPRPRRASRGKGPTLGPRFPFVLAL